MKTSAMPYQSLGQLLSSLPASNATADNPHLKLTSIYHSLVVFAGLSILVTYCFDYQCLDRLAKWQEANRIWNTQLNDVSKLQELAAEINNQAHEIFSSGNVELAANQMRPAESIFYARLAVLREELRSKSAQRYSPYFVRHLDGVDASMRKLAYAIERIHSFFRQNQPNLAVRELPVMESRFQALRGGLNRLREEISSMRDDQFRGEETAALTLSKRGFLLDILLLLIVGGSAFYGFRIARQANISARATKQRVKELAIFYSISQNLSIPQDTPALLQTIALRAQTLLSASGGIIFLFDTTRGDLEVAVQTDASTSISARLRLGESVAGRVAQTRQPLIVNDYPSWPHRTQIFNGMIIDAVVCVPMLCGGELIGVLGIHEIGKKNRTFTDDDERLLSLFAAQAASAVHSARLLDKVRRSEERFRIAAECATDNVYEWDLVGDRVEYFGAALEIARANGLHMPETRQEYNDALHPDDRARVQTALENHFKYGKPFAEEYRVVRSDGSHMYVADRGRAIRNQENSPVRLIGAASDITELKQAEHMKSDFVSFVTHQLRTPLTGVKWMLELAIDVSESPEQAQSYIRDARASTDRLIGLVNDLLDVNRLEYGKLPNAREEVNLAELTKSVIQELSPLILEKEHTLSCLADSSLSPLYADPQLLRQVVLNLVSNATKYTLPGGEISIRICSDGRQIRWEIKDSGIGIPKEGKRRLFEKFYRADNVLTVETEGTGLGLYIVRLIIEQHGGRVWCESEEGAGSTFLFTLPHAAESGGAGTNDQAGASSSVSRQVA